MKNNKQGFTLIELLAVVAILAILVVLAVPAILDIFTSSKKSTFLTQAQSIYKAAEEQVISKQLETPTTAVTQFDSITTANNLKLNGTTNIQYCIKIENNKITEFAVSDGVSYYYNNAAISSISDITLDGTNKIEEGKKNISSCTSGTVTFGDLFAYTISNGEVTITGFNSSLEPTGGVSDIAKCTAYLTSHSLGSDCGSTPSELCNASSINDHVGCNTLKSIIESNIPANDYDKAGIYFIDNRPKNLIIPSIIDGVAVTNVDMSINQALFTDTMYYLITEKGLENIVFSKGITDINDYGFAMSISDMNVGDAYPSSIKIILPDTLEQIGEGAFSYSIPRETYCLIDIVIPLSVEYAGRNIFEGNWRAGLEIKCEGSEDYTEANFDDRWNYDSGGPISVIYEYSE